MESPGTPCDEPPEEAALRLDGTADNGGRGVRFPTFCTRSRRSTTGGGSDVDRSIAATAGRRGGLYF